MTELLPSYQGEDVPIRSVFTDSDTGDPVAPDDTSTQPTITISQAGTDVVSGQVMTEIEVGTYEYVWDTATLFQDTGTYVVSVTGEFSTETNIEKATITVR